MTPAELLDLGIGQMFVGFAVALAVLFIGSVLFGFVAWVRSMLG